jgi:hypothetical protein
MSRFSALGHQLVGTCDAIEFAPCGTGHFADILVFLFL